VKVRKSSTAKRSAAASPFDTELARANSGYSRFIDEQLVAEDGGEPPRMASEVHAALRAVLHDPDFPCLGARSVVNQASYRFALYDEMCTEGTTAGLARDLARFIDELPGIEGQFASFITCFKEPKPHTPKPFEDALWKQLAMLHELDREHFAWSADVSSDPANPDFSFSFAGHPFFVVGLSPASPRWARRFPWPTLVFNDHFQFERLREEQRFEPMRDAIRERDAALHGETNPMLADFGKHSEARQYSGRKVGPRWKCPVSFEPKGE
jgi:FPC/CPF motif-containing protein YcgG